MYLSWVEQIITDFSDEKINTLYNEGYVFTRVGKGVMNQTRSVRIDLNKFELSSENRRVLKKTEELELKIENLPYKNYSWQIGKMAKDFYDTKFGAGTFTANKVKELLISDKSNFNLLLIYTFLPLVGGGQEGVSSIS
jgi:arginyl-tRNA--protein-N-Asp/Glu arginylyltransferase